MTMNTDYALDDLDRATILVVDDTPDNLTFISGLLRDHYRVKVATSGEKAMLIAQVEPHPDLILLDILMPGLDGYEVCQQLKADSKTKQIPIIFLTVKSDIEDERRGLELGAADYITKPVSPPILMARVKTQLNLKASYDSLQNLLRSREDMVNMIIHDLRNPITNILMLSEIFLENTDLPSQKLRKHLDIIWRSGQKLRTLVDDLLIKAKLESGHFILDRQKADLGELCQMALSEVQEIAGQKNLALDLSLPAQKVSPAYVDPVLIRRSVENLLSNAIKYSPSHSTIHLKLVYASPTQAMIQVTDEGPGVNAELRQRIFDKYEIGTLMQGVSQIGLGLAFCKLVVEAHGGTITVEDNQPRGAIFSITIETKEPNE
ncbi:response regulator [Leptolyngbya sp. BL0902]|uniref:hybrid sensor histidine kinase/response regulator n=1 Tax=Leptolyngbya sp. BL0902 TaxID=1115757 RepID=UPI001CECFE25|nr:response regulator [Leptolyngbya sp. BL0902]